MQPTRAPFDQKLTRRRTTQVPGDPVETLTIEADALSEGLQYGATAGLPSLNKWLENLQEMRHKRPKDGSWRLSLGSGSQDLINKVRSVAWSVTCGSLLTDLFLNLCTGLLLARQRGRQHPHGVAGVLVRVQAFEEFCSRRLTQFESVRLRSGTLGLLNRHKVNLIGTQLPRHASSTRQVLTSPTHSRRGTRRHARSRPGQARRHARQFQHQVPWQTIPEAPVHHVGYRHAGETLVGY